jgi:DNA-binding CsgD family transcriptional regulator
VGPGTEADVLRQGAPWRGPLAPRELVVLALLSVGYSPDQLPGLLRTTPEAVHQHLASAASQLGTLTWREAVREARRRGLID